MFFAGSYILGISQPHVLRKKGFYEKKSVYNFIRRELGGKLTRLRLAKLKDEYMENQPGLRFQIGGLKFLIRLF